MPALPEAGEPYREGEWANDLPDLSGEPARAGRSWMGLLGTGAVAAGGFGSRRSFASNAATQFNRDDQSVRMPSLSM